MIDLFKSWLSTFFINLGHNPDFGNPICLIHIRHYMINHVAGFNGFQFNNELIKILEDHIIEWELYNFHDDLNIEINS